MYRILYLHHTHTHTHVCMCRFTVILTQVLYTYPHMPCMPPTHSVCHPRTTVSQDVRTRFPVQLAFAKFLSKIKGNF